MVAGDPGQGGASWAILQYVLGLERLGHDVYLIEPIEEDSIRRSADARSRSPIARYFQSVVDRFAIADRAALLVRGGNEVVGVSRDRLASLAADADLLINVSGMLTDRALVDRIPVRVYLDLDPAFNQLWHAVDAIDMRFDGHTHFATVGQAIGSSSCAVPTAGRAWIPTLPPVVLSLWPPAERIERDAWTTVGNWRAYGSIEHDGRFYGQKAHSLREIISLPRLTSERLDLAIAIHPDEAADLAALAANGWHLVEPREVAGTPDAYQRFVAGSKGELGIAKSGYVVSRCGWFSDRSACYLASGRPVVAQETGFSEYLPTGEGLLAFESADDAAEAIDEVSANYERHAKAARAIAEEYFNSDRVLNSLLERVLG